MRFARFSPRSPRRSADRRGLSEGQSATCCSGGRCTTWTSRCRPAAWTLARRLAERLGGGVRPARQPHGMARVVVPGPPPFHVDLADLRASSTRCRPRRARRHDRRAGRRPRRAAARARCVQDPTGGLGDLAARRLRACRSTAFVDDPVRVLRVLRLGPPARVRHRAGDAGARAGGGSRPRVGRRRARARRADPRSTLPRTAPAVRQADAWSVLEVILPEVSAMREATQSAPHRFTVWEHSLRALEAADALVGGPPAARAPRRADLGLVRGADGERPHAPRGVEAGGPAARRGETGDAERGRGRAHPVHRPRPVRRRAGGGDRPRLRWPGRAREVLARLVRQHLRPMHLGMLDVVSRRARYRFHRDVGEEVPALLCLTISRRGRHRRAAARLASIVVRRGHSSNRCSKPKRPPLRRRPTASRARRVTSWLRSGSRRDRRWGARSSGPAKGRR